MPKHDSTAALGREDERLQREIWEARCPALLAYYDDAIAERDKARHLASHLFQMIDRETWRATGGDDGQGHYEGEYRAAGIEEEIRSWQ